MVGGDPYLTPARTGLEHAESPGLTTDMPTVETPAPERPPF
jgi:hypothetical protein